MTDSIRRLRMFAGPNGSGKTTLARRLSKEFSSDGLIPLYCFINADEILRSLTENESLDLAVYDLSFTSSQIHQALLQAGRLPPSHPFISSAQVIGTTLTALADACDSYAAAALADVLRDALLTAGRSFSFETVMSHPSKVAYFARAREAGYRTYLYYIATDEPRLNTARVHQRVVSGGHDVPQQKVLERYDRSLRLAHEAMAHAYRAFLFDNSDEDPVWLAELTPEGMLELKGVDSLPKWFSKHVASHYPCK